MSAAYGNQEVAHTVILEGVGKSDEIPAGIGLVEVATVDQLEVGGILDETVGQRGGRGVHQVNLAVVEEAGTGGNGVHMELHTLDFAEARQLRGGNDDLVVAVVVVAVGGEILGGAGYALGIGEGERSFTVTQDGSCQSMDSESGHCRGSCGRAVGRYAEGVVRQRVETVDGVSGIGDTGGHGGRVVVNGVGGTGAVGVSPHQCDAAVGYLGGHKVGHGQTGRSLGYMEAVIVSHSIAAGEAWIGIDGGGNGAGVAVKVAVGTRDTHAVETGILRGGNIEGGVQRGGVGGGGYAHIDHLVTVEGIVFVPVHPDDGAVVIASSIGDVHVGGSAGGNRANLVAIVTIVGCGGGTLAVVDNLASRTEGHVGDTAVVHRGGVGCAVAVIETDAVAPFGGVAHAADSADLHIGGHLRANHKTVAVGPDVDDACLRRFN